MELLIAVALVSTSGSQNFSREPRPETADLAPKWLCQKTQDYSTLAMQRGENIRTPKATRKNIMTVLVIVPITAIVLWMMR